MPISNKYVNNATSCQICEYSITHLTTKLLFNGIYACKVWSIQPRRQESQAVEVIWCRQEVGICDPVKINMALTQYFSLNS